ncbi:CoA transferase [Rhodococcus sp. IEGM 1354]|uniref:CoA transferase n=1 Tax=Rhodococcus sp. IEGM 1354 TaxID=3047088 RepID=UPI0024B83F7C|nr:CoA transferase [Rhodococcus sp. IEGM 1354]MDI9933692.1 CoA transferase [Rhodococcus sp. IEGM 1354]
MLDDVTVLEVGDRISTGFAGKMLRDAGATVVRVEVNARPELDVAGRDFAAYLHGGKHSVRLNSLRDISSDLPGLVSRADAVVCDGNDPAVVRALRALREQQPDLVVVSISDYGLNGASPSVPANEFTLQAECGLTAVHPTGDRPPVYAGIDIGEYTAGIDAAVGVVGGLLASEAGATAVDADISQFESMVGVLQIPWLYGQHDHHAAYTWPQAAVPGIEKAKDGWACIVAVTPQQWIDFKALVDIPELEDPRFAELVDRQHLTREVTPLIRSFTAQHTVAELVEMGARARVPIVPVATSKTVPELPPYTSRGTFVSHRDGFLQPRPAFRIEGDAWQIGELAEQGRDNDTDWGSRPERVVRKDADPARPLAGVRVLDFGSFQAGPLATRNLSSYGADVIKVESVTRPDLMRFAGPLPTAPDPWERGASFTATNWGKRSVTADLKDAEGHEIVERLVASSDLVIENFSPRVMEKVGFDVDGIRRLQPDAIVMRLPAWGLTGPWKDLPGFTYSADATSGLSDMTGYPEGEPLLTSTAYDPIAADMSTFVALAALRRKLSTGRGAAVEVSLCDVAPQTTAQGVIASSRTGERIERRGNDAPGISPQGMYRASDGAWVAVSIATDENWRALADVTGGAPWATATNRADLAGRLADRDLLDADLRDFVGNHESSELVERLHSVGVPAAIMQSGTEVLAHPAVVARGRNVDVVHLVNGSKEHLASPVRLSSQLNKALAIPRPSPIFGEHNIEVLLELGYTDDDIQRLYKDGKIGGSPFGLPIGERPPARSR